MPPPLFCWISGSVVWTLHHALPVVEELAQEHPEISFGKVNVDDVPELAQKVPDLCHPHALLFRTASRWICPLG